MNNSKQSEKSNKFKVAAAQLAPVFLTKKKQLRKRVKPLSKQVKKVQN